MSSPAANASVASASGTAGGSNGENVYGTSGCKLRLMATGCRLDGDGTSVEAGADEEDGGTEVVDGVALALAAVLPAFPAATLVCAPSCVVLAAAATAAASTTDANEPVDAPRACTCIASECACAWLRALLGVNVATIGVEPRASIDADAEADEADNEDDAMRMAGVRPMFNVVLAVLADNGTAS